VIHDKAKVVAHLRGLADGSVEPQDREYGICYELWNEFGPHNNDPFECDAWETIIGLLSKDWPEYSGNPHMPV